MAAFVRTFSSLLLQKGRFGLNQYFFYFAGSIENQMRNLLILEPHKANNINNLSFFPTIN
jgi:hypothetical protein